MLGTYGWSGEHWKAMSSAISMPRSRARDEVAKSSSVPSSGWIACGRLGAPIAHGLPTSPGRRQRVVAALAVRRARSDGSAAGRGRRSPSRRLAELAAHEQQLLAGVRPHVAVERAQVGELLPAVARHLVEQRALAVHDLVVRERQHEVLGERVDERERELVVVVAAVDRVARSSASVSCIQPMFHLKPKPRPPSTVGRETPATRSTPRRS
jgi:hypothetical protein